MEKQAQGAGAGLKGQGRGKGQGRADDIAGPEVIFAAEGGQRANQE